MSVRPILAVVPARGGSKGLPGKNIRPLAGLPLIAHTIAFARLCPQIARTVVTTDSDAIAKVATDAGAEVPFVRPYALAQDDTPMLPVLQHALREMENRTEHTFGSLLLLDPTSPGRLPDDVAAAVAALEADAGCDGVVGVSQPDFNPLWHCVVQEGDYMRDLFANSSSYDRRQDVPDVYRINASLYLWRRDFIARTDDWRKGRLRLHVVPEERAVHIDTPAQFDLVETLLRAGTLTFPWLEH